MNEGGAECRLMKSGRQGRHRIDRVHYRNWEDKQCFMRTLAHVIADLDWPCQVKATGRHPEA